MPRAVRIVFPAMVYHVTSWGNNRETFFLGVQDFENYLDICKRHKDRLMWSISVQIGIERYRKYAKRWTEG